MGGVLDRRMEELEAALLDLERRRPTLTQAQFLEEEMRLLGAWEDFRALREMCRLPLPAPSWTATG